MHEIPNCILAKSLRKMEKLWYSASLYSLRAVWPQVGSMQEQNGSLSEKLSQAEARLTEAHESSSSKAQNFAVQLEQAQTQNSQIQVGPSLPFLCL